jgi:hypothetical protein
MFLIILESKWAWSLFVYYFYFKYFVANAFISPFNTQTIHVKPVYTQQHCYVFLKPYPLAGFEPWGGCDVHCATPPGRTWSLFLFYKSWLYVYLVKVVALWWSKWPLPWQDSKQRFFGIRALRCIADVSQDDQMKCLNGQHFYISFLQNNNK